MTEIAITNLSIWGLCFSVLTIKSIFAETGFKSSRTHSWNFIQLSLALQLNKYFIINNFEVF
jgi:hypothetical protein